MKTVRRMSDQSDADIKARVHLTKEVWVLTQ